MSATRKSKGQKRRAKSPVKQRRLLGKRKLKKALKFSDFREALHGALSPGMVKLDVMSTTTAISLMASHISQT